MHLALLVTQPLTGWRSNTCSSTSLVWRARPSLCKKEGLLSKSHCWLLFLFTHGWSKEGLVRQTSSCYTYCSILAASNTLRVADLTSLGRFVLKHTTALWRHSKRWVGTIRHTPVLVLEVFASIDITLVVLRSPAVRLRCTLFMTRHIFSNCC